jgi:hypothetical protein
VPPPAPPFPDPRRDRPRVGPGLAREHRGLAGQRLIRLALTRALEDPGHLGQQVGPAARELAQRGDRGGLFVAGEVTPPRVVPRLPRELSYEGSGQLPGACRAYVLVSHAGDHCPAIDLTSVSISAWWRSATTAAAARVQRGRRFINHRAGKRAAG